MRKLFLLLVFLGMSSCTVDALPYTFSLVPRTIKVQGKKSTIALSLLLDPAFNIPNVELKATKSGAGVRFSYSRNLKTFMKSLHLKKSDFAPFRRHLITQLKKAKKNPATYITMLSAYLTTGAAPNYTIDFQ